MRRFAALPALAAIASAPATPMTPEQAGLIALGAAQRIEKAALDAPPPATIYAAGLKAVLAERDPQAAPLPTTEPTDFALSLAVSDTAAKLPAERIDPFVKTVVDAMIDTTGHLGELALFDPGSGHLIEPLRTQQRPHSEKPEVTIATRNGTLIITIQAIGPTLPGVVRQALAQHPGGVILDLRGCPGGLLDKAVEVADLFKADGTIAVTSGHAGSRQVYRAHSGDPGERVPLAILVDGETALAGELVAAALKGRPSATVIGSPTTGADLVRTIFVLDGRHVLFLPTSRLRGPDEHFLSDKVIPDVTLAPGDDGVSAALRLLSRATAH